MINLTSLNLIALICGFFGSVLVCFGLFLSDDQIKTQSSTYLSCNVYQRRALMKNRDMGIFGTVLLSISFFIQAYCQLVRINSHIYFFHFSLDKYIYILFYSIILIFVVSFFVRRQVRGKFIDLNDRIRKLDENLAGVNQEVKKSTMLTDSIKNKINDCFVQVESVTRDFCDTII